MRAAIRPRPTSPPTAPPTIAGTLIAVVLLPPPPLLLAAAGEDDAEVNVEIYVLGGAGREDSMPLVL